MIIGMGSDIFEVSRLAGEFIADDETIKHELFTETEIRYCENMHYPERHFAARFAAKEAFFKALGTGKLAGMRWRDVEIANDDSGAPLANLYGAVKEIASLKQASRIFISMSHTRQIASATVIIEK